MKKRPVPIIKVRKVALRLNVTTSLQRGTGGCNPCFRPSLGASLSDLREFHKEDLALRRSRQLARKPNSAPLIRTKNDDPAYRKSIWPAGKSA